MHLQNQSKLTKLLNNTNTIELLKRGFTGLLLSIVIFYTLIATPKIFSLLMLITAILILKLEWVKICSNIIKNYGRSKAIFYTTIFYIITLIYILIPFTLIIYFALSKYGKLNLYLFSLIFAHDSGSYIFGRLFGFHKICPKVSPKKSLEGALGGFIAVIIAFLIFNKYNTNKITLILLISFSLLISIVALFGDLFESYLKRLANTKDSGTLLPGHGGLLDRFDSILLNVYLIYLLKNYLL